MKIVFFGSSEFSVPSLSVLAKADFVDISCVVTRPDRPSGRNLRVKPSPVKLEAERIGLPVYQPEHVSAQGLIANIGNCIDLFVVVSFGEIFPPQVLSIPRICSVNLHPSLLPRYRGPAPVAGALLNGDTETGITIFRISDKMDSGDIIMQSTVPICPDDTRGSLELKMSYEGAYILKDALYAIDSGTAVYTPQDGKCATYTRRLQKKDGLICWDQGAEFIHNKVRAMNPWPGAFTYFGGQKITIWETSIVDFPDPGNILFLDEKRIGVSTGKGILIIEQLQAEGKKRMSALSFMNGAMNKNILFRFC